MWQTNSHDKFLVFTFKVDLVIFTLDVVVVSKLKVGGMPIVFAHKKYEKSSIFIVLILTTTLFLVFIPFILVTTKL